MAAIKINSGQENGDALPEEKSLAIDYSEDLWLANSEDSSGPYAQQASKVLSQEPSSTYSSQSDVRGSYQDSYATHQPVDAHAGEGIKSEYSQAQLVNDGSQVWSEVLPEPAAGYVNGLVEQNGEEFNSSGEEKDFAQLVPAGSYVENGGVTGDKTFTSLMPAAALDGKEDVQPQYSTMIEAHQQQMVYYSTTDQMNTDSARPAVTHDNLAFSYDPSVQVMAVNGEQPGNGDHGSGAVYISMDNLNVEGQAVTPSGSFSVMSPAVIRLATVNGEDQSYSSQIAGSSYQHISTLPFVHNGAYTAQTSFPSYQSTPNVSGYGTSQTNVVDCQEDEEDEEEEEDEVDEDANQDMEEFSELTCPVCGEAFLDQSSLEDHVSNHPALKTFVCGTCGKGFATRRYLRYHRKNHCKRAGSYEGRNDLDENDPNGEVKRFSCNVCNRFFRVLKCMKVHKKKKHDILKEFTCHSCAITFDSSQELIDHPCEIKKDKNTPQAVHYTPPSLVTPTSKKKKKLKNARPMCDICGKTFSDRISVDIHRVKHIEEELYPCDMCSEDMNGGCNHNAVYFRIRFFTDDNQHILEDQKAAIANHDLSRSDDGSSVPATPQHHPGSATPQSAPATPVYLPATPTHPTGTSVSASHNNSLTDYEVGVHQLEQLARASQMLNQSDLAEAQPEVNQNNCLSTTNQSSLINQQEGEQHEDSNTYSGDVVHDASGTVLAVTPKRKKLKSSKEHTCDVCNKSFGDVSKLEVHIKTNHLTDRPYQCDICEKSFFTKWKLQRHTLSHLEQKPHSCPMCSKSFVERGKLDAHYRTHLGTKPYKCDQCQKTFTVKSQLSIHQRRIHSSDQPFGCLVCGKAFLWKSGLEKHMRKHTKEKPYECESCGIQYANKANLIVHMSNTHKQTYIDKQSP